VLTLRERRSTSQDLTPREFIRHWAQRRSACHLPVICLATDNIHFRYSTDAWSRMINKLKLKLNQSNRIDEIYNQNVFTIFADSKI